LRLPIPLGPDFPPISFSFWIWARQPPLGPLSFFSFVKSQRSRSVLSFLIQAVSPPHESQPFSPTYRVSSDPSPLNPLPFFSRGPSRSYDSFFSWFPSPRRMSNWSQVFLYCSLQRKKRSSPLSWLSISHIRFLHLACATCLSWHLAFQFRRSAAHFLKLFPGSYTETPSFLILTFSRMPSPPFDQPFSSFPKDSLIGKQLFSHYRSP